MRVLSYATYCTIVHIIFHCSSVAIMVVFDYFIGGFGVWKD